MTQSDIKKALLKLRGKFRLFFGFCPGCNSDAPELYDCEVCRWYSTSEHGMPDKIIKAAWWGRFINQINKIK